MVDAFAEGAGDPGSEVTLTWSGSTPLAVAIAGGERDLDVNLDVVASAGFDTAGWSIPAGLARAGVESIVALPDLSAAQGWEAAAWGVSVSVRATCLEPGTGVPVALASAPDRQIAWTERGVEVATSEGLLAAAGALGEVVETEDGPIEVSSVGTGAVRVDGEE